MKMKKYTVTNDAWPLGFRRKSFIFDILAEKRSIMKGFSSNLKGWLSLFLVTVLSAFQLTAQTCNITFDGSLCVGAPITFLGSAQGSNHRWTFNDGGTDFTNNGPQNATFAFAKAGNAKATYITTLSNGQQCTSTVNLVIKEKPKIKMSIVTMDSQCFQNNLFCFIDSTETPSGSPVIRTQYLVSDGQLFEYDFPPSVLPNKLCFSIKDVRGGPFDVFVEAIDKNGCTDTQNLVGAVFVREKIGAAFTSNKPVQCDSVLAQVKNVSRIGVNAVDSIWWYWGDGTVWMEGDPNITSKTWGPDLKKWFYGQGIYNSKLIIRTKDGCKDSFSMTATATVFASNVIILASRDSTCISEPTIDFRTNIVPSGASGLLWNFGDPNTGPQNFNNRTWSPSHDFSGLGPFLIKLQYKHPVCGDREVYDTIIILGPNSTIDIMGDRIPDWQVYQCPKDVMDTVGFRNYSTFYHNDKDYTDDDSTFYKNGTTALGHTFQWNNVTKKPIQIWEAPTRRERNTRGDSTVYVPSGGVSPAGGNDPLKRENYCVVRLWDFGDNYGSKCTTDVVKNKNVTVNCAYSHDSIPFHYYRSWDLVMLSDFKRSPMEDAIFIDSNGLCKRVPVFADSIFYVYFDSLMAIPPVWNPNYSFNPTTGVWTGRWEKDSATYKSTGTKVKPIWRLEKKVLGPAERYMEDFIKVRLGAKDTIYVGTKGSEQMLVGPRDTLLRPEQNILVKSKTDSFEFLYTLYLKPDTLPRNLMKIRWAKGEKLNIVDSFKRIPNGIAGFDYFINYNRFRELYYSRIPACNNVRLSHKDTCHVLKCESQAVKQLALLHANAGGVGSGLIKDAVECLGAANPTYGVTFILSDLKPGCSFSEVQINYDTFCNPNGWVPLNGLNPGGRPLNPPGPWWNTAYNLSGSVPSRFSWQYPASGVCNTKTQCVTVGIIVGNGIQKVPGATLWTKWNGNNGKRPLCQDTHYYDKFACFPLIDPASEIIKPTPGASGFRKICKWDEIIVREIAANKTNTRDLKSMRWMLSTGDAGPYYARSWNSFIQEDYYHYQKNVPGQNKKYIYNYIVQTRGRERPYQGACSNDWYDGQAKVYGGPDTIITAEIRKYTMAADVSKVWENIKKKLEDRGFDPFSLTDAQIFKMIWNDTGVIGQPKTGAYGCIDTTGFGKDIRYYYVPDPDSTFVLHYRDSLITPIDTWTNPATKLKMNAYRFVPEHSGFHIMSLSMTSNNGKCEAIWGQPIIVGFAMIQDKFTDSIVCQDQGESLVFAPDYRYFNVDPQNNGQWDWNYYWNPNPLENPTQYDYWKDANRYGKNLEPRTRWDWNKGDDDTTNKVTIFGGSPYGGTSVGTTNNPYIQLGGGSDLYYKNDSGVYTFRNIAGDSTGCKDTMTKRLFVTRLDVKFGLNLEVPSCNTTIEFYDSSILHDPCSWAMKNCTGATPMACDYINKWFIDWGDGYDNYYEKLTFNGEGLPARIGHKYTRNGWFKIQYVLFTEQGCSDTFSRWVKIPGPRPKFEYTTKAGNFVTICVGDSIEFSNMSDSATKGAVWTWYFGDGNIKNDTSENKAWHTYKKAGLYEIYLQQYDTLFLPPNTYRYCPAVFPDTNSFQQKFQVLVLPRDSVRGTILRASICPGDSNVFIDNSDTILKVYKWKFVHYSKKLGTYVTDTVTTGSTRYARVFDDPGNYTVYHYADYDPQHPRPWCPSDMDSLTFMVDSVYADFDIDSSNKPDFVFTRKDINGVEWRWGFGHGNDIANTLPRTFREDLKSNDVKVKWSYDSTDVYWVCLIAKNSTGCEDTICKPVTVDLFVYLANVFTPGNQDGKNDYFDVPLQGQDHFEIRIFNRWGERVFKSEDPKVKWNGQINNDGPDAPSGTYFYQMEYRFKGKEKINRVNGSVNLIRPN